MSTASRRSLCVPALAALCVCLLSALATPASAVTASYNLFPATGDCTGTPVTSSAIALTAYSDANTTGYRSDCLASPFFPANVSSYVVVCSINSSYASNPRGILVMYTDTACVNLAGATSGNATGACGAGTINNVTRASSNVFCSNVVSSSTGGVAATSSSSGQNSGVATAVGSVAASLLLALLAVLLV